MRPTTARPHAKLNLLFTVAAIVVRLGAWKLSVHQFASRERQLVTLVSEKTEARRAANENCCTSPTPTV